VAPLSTSWMPWWRQQFPSWSPLMAKQRGKKSSKRKSSAGHAGAKQKAPISQSRRIFNEAEMHKKAGKLYEAEQAYKAVLALNPNHCPSLAQLAYMAIDAGRLPIALNYAKKAVEADHGDPQLHLVLATVLANLGLVDLAESELMIALQLDKENSHILNALGNAYAQQGRFDEAINTFRQAIAISPENVGPYYNLASSKRFTPDDPDLELITGLRNLIPSSSEEDRILIRFAMGKAYHDCGEYAQAFEEYRQGNGLKSQSITYSHEAQEKLTDHLIKVQDAAWVERVADAGSTAAGAIFIVGMPRSGTTLLESLLRRHPQISGIGESPYIGNLARSCGQRAGQKLEYPDALAALTQGIYKELGDEYVSLAHQFGVSTTHTVDKTPENFLYLGFILAILPNAKLVHNFRDPVDACLSIYQQYFTRGVPYACDLKQIALYYLLYRRLMEHWQQLFPDKILDVSYENVVVDTEGQTRRIIEFCDLPWDDGCLNEKPDRHQNITRTASIWQARQPVYQSSVHRWRNYEKHLGTLLEVLAPVL